MRERESLLQSSIALKRKHNRNHRGILVRERQEQVLHALGPSGLGRRPVKLYLGS
jgi:hypothetical protein